MNRLPTLSLVLLLGAGCDLVSEELEVGETSHPLSSDNGLTLNGLSLNGLSLNGLSLADLSQTSLNFDELNHDLQDAIVGDESKPRLARAFLTYFAKCALNPGQRVTIFDTPGAPSQASYDAHLDGALGLAPQWPNVSQAVKDRVASCVAAHINTNGGVSVSLRALWLEYPSYSEEYNYPQIEGGVRGYWQADGIVGYTCTGRDNAYISNRSFIRNPPPNSGFTNRSWCISRCYFHPLVGYYYCSGSEFDDDRMMTAFAPY